MPQCTDVQVGKYLSEVGLEARDTLEFSKSLPSFERVVRSIEEFLGRPGTREGRIWKTERPCIMLLLGDWGEGKTAVYHGLIRVREDLESLFVTAESLLQSLPRGLSVSAGARLLLAIGRKLLNSDVSVHDVVPRILEVVGDKRLIVFIDEFEYLATLLESPAGTQQVSEFIEGIVQLTNVEDVLGEIPGYRSLAPKLHFVIAVTRRAYALLESRAELSQVMGRFRRRLCSRVEMRRFTRLETIALLQRLFRYMTGAELEKVVSDTCLLNPLLVASLGVPGAIEHGVNSLASALTHLCNGRLARLDFEVAPRVYEDVAVTVEGVTEKILSLHDYRRLLTRCSQRLGEEECKRILLCLFGKGYDYKHGVVGFDEARAYLLRVDPVKALREITSIIEDILATDKSLQEVVKEVVERSEDIGLEAYRALLDPYVYACEGKACLVLPVDYRRDAEERFGVDRVHARELERLASMVVDRLVEKRLAEHIGSASLVPLQMLREYIFSYELALLSFIRKDERYEVWRRVYRVPTRELLYGLAVFTVHAIRHGIGGDWVIEKIEESEGALQLVLRASRLRELRVFGDRVRVSPEARVLIVAARGGSQSVDKIEAVLSKFNPHVVVVSSLGEAVATSIEEACWKRKIPVLPVRLRHVDAVKIAALAYVVNSRFPESDRPRVYEALADAVRGVASNTVSSLFESEVYDVLSQIARESGVASLVENMARLLEENGILLPRTIQLPKEGLAAVLDSLRWLVFAPRSVIGIQKAFEIVEENVRRHLVYGKRYEDVIGRDLESARMLAEYVKHLEQLGIVHVDSIRGEIRLSYMDSPLVQRLVDALQGDGLGIPEASKLFIWLEPEPLEALIESLEILGIVEYQNGRIALRNADALIARIRSTLERIRRDYGDTIECFGCIVSGKKRGYRASLTNDLIDVIESYVNLANLTRGFEKARLATAAERLLREVLGEKPEHDVRRACSDKRHLSLAEASRLRVNKLLSLLEEYVVKLSNLVEQQKRELSKYVRVEKVESTLLDALRRGIEEVRRLRDSSIARSECEKLAEELWRRGAPEDFPFYYRVGARYCYNMKLYVCYSRLAEILGVSIDAVEPEKLREVLDDWMNDLKAKLKSVYDMIAKVDENLKVVREELSRLKDTGFVQESLTALQGTLTSLMLPECGVVNLTPRTFRGTERSIESLLECVSSWYSSTNIDRIRESVERVKRYVEEIERLKRHYNRLASTAPLLLDEISKLLGVKLDPIGVEASLPGASGARAESLEELEARLSRLYGELNRIYASLNSEVEKRVSTIKRLIEERVNMLLGKLEGYSIVERLADLTGFEEMRRISEEASRLRRKLHSILERVERIDVEDAVNALVELRGVAYELRDVEQALERLPDRPEDLVEKAAVKYGLSRDEVQVLMHVARSGRVRVKELAEKMGKSIEELVRILASLAERGLIELLVEGGKQV